MLGTDLLSGQEQTVISFRVAKPTSASAAKDVT